MNEGHAAFLTLERARELVQAGRDFGRGHGTTRRRNVFTTHTPVPAGNDEFPLWLVEKHLAAFWPELKLEREQFFDLARRPLPEGETFSMGVLALRNSLGRNAVSELHGRVARRMWNFLWPDARRGRGSHYARHERRSHCQLDGTPPSTSAGRVPGPGLVRSPGRPTSSGRGWMPFRTISSGRFGCISSGNWRSTCASVSAEAGPQADIIRCRSFRPGVLINPYALTIGFARRFATYKRADLILSDMDRLLEILNRPNRPVQIIFAGKAHPADDAGKRILQDVYRVVKRAEASGRLVFLEDYDINLARYLVQGVDVWLNTPRRPLEASGTSGMKAALNGVSEFLRPGWLVARGLQRAERMGDRRGCRSRGLGRAGRPGCRGACTVPWSMRSFRCTMSAIQGDLACLAGAHEGIDEDDHSALQHAPHGQGIRGAPVRSGVEVGMFRS